MWNFFDQINCINLYTRNDRLIRSYKVFKKLGIPVIYYRVHKHSTDGVKGCYESHLSVIKNAYYNGCRNLLIFEDDVVESPYFSNKLIEKAINFMKENENWEIFYLGHQPNIFWKSSEVISDEIIKTQSTLTHAYVISRKYMEKIIDRSYDGIAIDQIYLKNQQSYALYPMAFYQDESDSDIPASAPIRGLRFSEIYAYNINYPIINLIFLLFFFLIIFLTYKYI